MSNDTWTAEEENTVARLWCVEGMPYRDIGYELNRTKSSVYRCIKRLDLNGHKGDVMAFEELYGGEAVSMPFRPVRLNVEPPAPITEDKIDHISLHWGDIQFPFQDQRAVDVLYEVASDLQPDILVEHGDLLDNWQISSHRPPEEKHLSPHQIDLQDSINQAVEHLGTMQVITNAKERYYTLGNHEDRWERVMADLQRDYKVRHILALDNIKDVLTLEHVMGLDELGWEWVKYNEGSGKTITLFDRLVITHGHLTNKWAARSMMELYGKSVMFGHTHRFQVFSKTTLKGQEAGFNLGCMCDINPHYTPFANWQQGFAVVHWHNDSDLGWMFDVHNVRIHRGRAVYNDRVYKA